MDFALPEIGEGVYEAELVSWLVKPGDAVKRGQNLAEVLTDKATMEVPSPFIGTVTALHARPGQMVKVGDVLLSYTAATGVPPLGGEGQPPSQDRPSPPEGGTPTARGSTGAEQPAAVLAAAAAPAAPDGRHNGPALAETPGRLPVKAAPSVRYL